MGRINAAPSAEVLFGARRTRRSVSVDARRMGVEAAETAIDLDRRLGLSITWQCQ
jgi:hypothetical protein